MSSRRSCAAVMRRARRHACNQAVSRCIVVEALECRNLLAAVSGITLINADTDQAVGGSVSDNGTLNIDLKSMRRINFRADAIGAGSVKFGYDGNTNVRVEGGAPYAFASNNGADYFSFTPTVGTHSLTATPYTGGGGASGTAGATYKITLKVVDTGTSAGTTTPPVMSTSAALGTPPTIPAHTVLFDNFDLGNEGVAYHDSDSVNAHGQYRAKGVDIETTTDALPSNLQASTGSGFSVGTVKAGEWLKYTVNVSSAGTYKFDVRFASANAGGSAHLEVDGKNIGSIALTGTGGWQNWKTIEKGGFVLPAGTHVLRFFLDSSASSGDVGNLHWFRFAKTSSTTTPPSDTSTPLKWPSGWSTTTPAPSGRFESAGHVFGGKIYAFGGFKNSDFDVDRTYVSFDPNTMSWTKLGTLPVGMAETHAALADDGHYIYFLGGFAGDFRHGQKPVQVASSAVWRYEPSTNTWARIATLPFARGAGGASIINGKLHYFGGNPADRVTNIPDHIVLDLNNISAGWKYLAGMPVAKDHFSTITIGSKIYTIGGEKGHDVLADIQKSVYVYDDNANSWKRLADMPYTDSHSEGGTFVMDGQIVFAGGQWDHAQEATNRVSAYDIQTNKWTTLAPLPAYRQGSIVGVFGNKVIVALGAQFTSVPSATTWVGYR